jgi:DNA-binding transcriptional ArsR family regulator
MGFQETFRALGDATRRRMLELLKGGRRSAGELAAEFKLSNATISHHLAILREAGLVSEERQGKFIYYELRASVLEEAIGWLITVKEEKHESLRKNHCRADSRAGGGTAAHADDAAGTNSDPLESCRTS